MKNPTPHSMGSSPLLQNYSRYPVDLTHGRGAYVYDANGLDYLDFLSGISVCNFGHRHPFIEDAVGRQVKRLWHISNLFESSMQESLARRLVDASGLDRVFFCNSGSEANEAALKFARVYGRGRSHVISTEGAFHGRTFGSLSATWQTSYRSAFEPLVPGFSFVPYGDADAAEKAITPDTVAMIVEPIQGENGIVVPPESYLAELRTICDRNDVLLILDEVQTGLGRTGWMFGYQASATTPDILTLAKGIANGLPLGAALCTEKIGKLIEPGLHGSTFGGNLVAVAAACAVMELLDDSILQHVHTMGEIVRREIRELNADSIADVRGRGLMIGLEFQKGISAKTVARTLLDAGVIVGTSGDSVVRLLPPFIIRDEEIHRFLEVFRSTIQRSTPEEVSA